MAVRAPDSDSYSGLYLLIAQKFQIIVTLVHDSFSVI